MSKCVLPILAVILAWAPGVRASGFQLREQSPAGQGNAFAGASAGAQDISSMFWNPAVLPLFTGTQASLGASWIGIRMEPSGVTGTRAPGFQPTSQPIAGSSSTSNAATQPVVPCFYLSWALDDRFSLGFSVNVPYGLETNYPNDFAGRYYGLKTSLTTYDLAPAAAWRINPQWTAGVALVARRATATISNGVDFGAAGNSLGIPGLTPGGSDAVATLSGAAWAFGYKAGLTWQPAPDLRVGLAYQGKTDVDIKGAVSYTSVPGLLSGTVTNSLARATLNLPAVFSAGATWTVNPDFSLAGEAAWTQWSTFKELRVHFDSGQPDDVTDESWKDTWFVSVGGIWRLDSAWSVKAGLAYDRSPVDNAHRTPRIPDSDRTWVAAGVAWRATPSTTVDFGATQIFAPDVRVDLKSGSSPTDPNYGRGNLTGSYKVGVTVFALSVLHSF